MTTMKIKRITIALAILSCSLLKAQQPTALHSLRNNDDSCHIFVAAHRADWKYAPENSLQGLKNALFFGADIIECDVRPTRDGHFVMMHDATVDRMTYGTGNICDMTLEEIKTLRLRTNWGQSTLFPIATLDEYIEEAKGRAYLYLDKAGIDLPGQPEGETVRQLLNVLRRHNALQESLFVLNWPYEKARRIFGTALDSVIYCPVIEDRIPNLSAYVSEYIEKLHPACFQFRMASLDTETYRMLPVVLAAGCRAFVASTWPQHTANHDDLVSIFQRPSAGWGWLIEQGFTILETNFPKDLIQYLKSERRHK